MKSFDQLPDYETIYESLYSANRLTIRYFSKPGIVDWDRVRPSARLIAENIDLDDTGAIAYFGCGHGAAAAMLAKNFPHCQFALIDVNYIALRMSERTIKANRLNNVSTQYEYPYFDPKTLSFQGRQNRPSNPKIDASIIDLPKGRSLARQWLTLAYQIMQIGGTLYLAGANKEGIQSILKDAEELFEQQATIIANKKGNRLARFIKRSPNSNPPTWCHSPGIAPGTWSHINLKTPLGPFSLVSLPGVFSSDRLDKGTELLLRTLRFNAGERILDVGCGMGILGIFAAKSGVEYVDLLDVNLLAIAATQKNIESHRLQNARALASDVLNAVHGSTYDHIISNPPFHAGKGVDYQMALAFIKQSHTSLRRNGRFSIVANKFIRYDRMMRKFYRQVLPLAETGQYQVWQGVK